MAEGLSPKCSLKLIVAFDVNFGIGMNGRLPWPRLEMDMKHFQSMVTTTHNNDKRNVIISGRKTWESIPVKIRGHFYSKCFRVVLTNSLFGVECADMISCSLKQAIRSLSSHAFFDDFESFWVIGGRTTYQEALDSPYTLKIYTTWINMSYACDTFFPKINWSEWVEIHDSSVYKEEIVEKNIKFVFKVYMLATDHP